LRSAGTYIVSIVTADEASHVTDLTQLPVTKFAPFTIQTVIGNQYAVGRQPTALEFDGAGIWVMNQASFSVSRIVTSTGQLQGTYSVPGMPLAAISVGGIVWVASSRTPPGTSGGGYLTALDAGGNIHQNFAVQQQPLALAAVQVYEGQTITLYFVDPNSDFLWSLDPTTGDVLAVGQIGGLGARALLFDGTNLWISNSMSNTVSKMDKYWPP
jgi:hypothetical protein